MTGFSKGRQSCSEEFSWAKGQGKFQAAALPAQQRSFHPNYFSKISYNNLYCKIYLREEPCQLHSPLDFWNLSIVIGQLLLFNYWSANWWHQCINSESFALAEISHCCRMKNIQISFVTSEIGKKSKFLFGLVEILLLFQFCMARILYGLTKTWHMVPYVPTKLKCSSLPPYFISLYIDHLGSFF